MSPVKVCFVVPEYSKNTHGVGILGILDVVRLDYSKLQRTL
jgi:GDP-D-mannose dehydratase